MLLTVRDCITASTPHVCRIAILANYMPLSCRFGCQSVPVKAFVTMLVLGLAKPIFHGYQLRLSPQRKVTYQRNFSVPIVQVEKSILPVSGSLWLEVFLFKNSFHILLFWLTVFQGRFFKAGVSRFYKNFVCVLPQYFLGILAQIWVKPQASANSMRLCDGSEANQGVWSLYLKVFRYLTIVPFQSSGDPKVSNLMKSNPSARIRCSLWIFWTEALQWYLVPVLQCGSTFTGQLQLWHPMLQ